MDIEAMKREASETQISKLNQGNISPVSAPTAGTGKATQEVAKKIAPKSMFSEMGLSDKVVLNKTCSTKIQVKEHVALLVSSIKYPSNTHQVPIKYHHPFAFPRYVNQSNGGISCRIFR